MKPDQCPTTTLDPNPNRRTLAIRCQREVGHRGDHVNGDYKWMDSPHQCPATTIDRATDEETRCILPEGHEGRHDDGCLTWTWGDVRPIFGTVTAAGPPLADWLAERPDAPTFDATAAVGELLEERKQGADAIRAALVETLRFSDTAKPLFRYGDRAITGPEMVALLDARDPIAEDFMADVVFGAVQAIKSIFPLVPSPASTPEPAPTQGGAA